MHDVSKQEKVPARASPACETRRTCLRAGGVARICVKMTLQALLGTGGHVLR